MGVTLIQNSASRWLTIRLEALGGLLVLLTALLVIAKASSIDAAMAGLALRYALDITNSLTLTTRVSTKVLRHMYAFYTTNQAYSVCCGVLGVPR